MRWWSRVRKVFRKDRLDRDLEAELRFHAEQRAAELGTSLEQAYRRLGHTPRWREESRDAKLALWLDERLQDLRYSLRVWRRRPVAATAAILTVALGTGLNLAVAQLIWSVLLKPLPYPAVDRLVQVWVDDRKEERSMPDNAQMDRWRESSRSFTHLASYRAWRMTVASGGEPEQVYTGLVSPEFFPTLGTPLLMGRTFTADEVKAGADQVLLVRESYWRRRFAANAHLLGSDIAVDGMLCRVIGIVPDSFAGMILSAKGEPELYLPISRARVAGMRVPVRSSNLLGRLREGVSAAAARDELAALVPAGDQRRVWLSPLQSEIAYQLRPALLALLAATTCVLLIACANLANLLLAQAAARSLELSVRAALGAGRRRIVRQLLTETALLLVGGSVLGLALAAMLQRTLATLYPGTLPRTGDSVSWKVYGVASILTLLTGLLFGMVPAWRATREAAEEPMRVSSQWMSRGNRRWADGMVAVQVALTAVVLIAAGLLGRSFLALRDVDIGLAREHVITASVDLPGARYKTRDDRARFGEQWVERLQALPQVDAAGISNSVPLRYTTLLDVLVHVPGYSDEQRVGGRAVGGDYFAAAGMRFAAGVPFAPRRTDQVVVNEAFVRRYLGGRDAVGTVLEAGSKKPSLIVGVVRDVRHVGLRDAAKPELYMPFSQFPLNPVDTVIRSTLPPAQIEAALRRELRAVDSQLALGQVMTMDAVVADQLARPRFQATLLTLFAVVALMLAAVGTYGVIAHHVRSRMGEFGLRRALGAQTADLFRLVMAEGMRAPLAGLTIGLLIGWLGLGRWLQALLYGVTPHDPPVLLLTAGVLLLAGALACALPGYLAARVEPSRALRQQ